jgi:hypothetical protein
MEQLYMKLSLDKDGRTNHWGEPGIGEQAHHLRIASALTAAELVQDFLKSVTHYAGYEYDQRFYPRDRNPLTEDKHRPRKDTDLKTSSIAWWLERYDGELRDASQSSLGIEYVARELVPLRTAGQGREMSRRSRRSRRLDLVLRAPDGAPVVTEVKAKTDQHPFYGVIQALMHVSQLASPAQRKRLTGRFPTLVSSGPVDVCLILAANSRYFFEPAGGRKRQPAFKPQLAHEAQRLCEGFVGDARTQDYVRTITWLEGSMIDGKLVFAERLKCSLSS